MSKQLRLAGFLWASHLTHSHAQWRHPRQDPGFLTPEYYQNLARMVAVQNSNEAQEAAEMCAGLRSEHCIPDLGRPVLFDAKPSEFELTSPDPVHEFDASEW